MMSPGTSDWCPASHVTRSVGDSVGRRGSPTKGGRISRARGFGTNGHLIGNSGVYHHLACYLDGEVIWRISWDGI